MSTEVDDFMDEVETVDLVDDAGTTHSLYTRCACYGRRWVDGDGWSCVEVHECESCYTARFHDCTSCHMPGAVEEPSGWFTHETRIRCWACGTEWRYDERNGWTEVDWLEDW